ncbi:MAG: YCF48-related protein [Pseudomonadota bacterium]
MLLPLAASAGKGFADVLDTPAANSALAARALINGLAKAGQRIVGVGQRGHIVFSDDQGKSWTQAKVPLSADLVAVHFPSPRRGWAVGHDGVVLHSADAGASWVRQPLALQVPDKTLLDVWFESDKRGFAVGAFNLILRTEDGGASWQPWMDRIDNPKGLHLNAIRLVGPDLYIVGEQGLVHKLAKDGDRFEAVPTPYAGSYFGVIGNASAVLAFGLRGNAWRSTDAGRSWQKVETGVQVGLSAATVLPDARLALISQAGHVLLSADDGASFRAVDAARGATSAAVAGANGQLVLAGVRGVRGQAVPNK